MLHSSLLLKVGAITFVVGAATIALLGLQASGSTGRPDDQAVSLVEQAVIAQQQVAVPATTETAALAARSFVPHMVKLSRLRHPDHAQLMAARTRGRERLDTILAGRALQAADRTLDHALAQESEADFVAYGGGASDFRGISTDKMAGGGVKVTLSAITWSGIGQIQGDHVVTAHPHNTIIVTSTVEQTPDGPRVVDYSWAFAPGSEP